jgi:hypothetical protein
MQPASLLLNKIWPLVESHCFKGLIIVSARIQHTQQKRHSELL